MRAAKTILALAVATSLLCGCTNSDAAREQMRRESENNCGVMRTVTAYSLTGEKIGEWHGKIDVAYADTSSESSHMERVDIVVFDGDEPIDRVVISGAIVVVDNDGDAE